jgi:phosphoribosylanthranilate isomerase
MTRVNRTFVKICGLRAPSDIAAAVTAGADAVGFVFAESPRRVSIDQAVALAREVPEHIAKVAVMQHPSQFEWDAVIDGFEPDWVQTDAADLQTLAVPDSVYCMPVYRDTPAFDPTLIDHEMRILFEAPHSGVGAMADWDKAAALALNTQLMLAGGLDPDNIATAIRIVRPWGVDVSSGVEQRRGVKDPNKIAAFVSAVRELETMDAS